MFGLQCQKVKAGIILNTFFYLYFAYSKMLKMCFKSERNGDHVMNVSANLVFLLSICEWSAHIDLICTIPLSSSIVFNASSKNFYKHIVV